MRRATAGEYVQLQIDQQSINGTKGAWRSASESVVMTNGSVPFVGVHMSASLGDAVLRLLERAQVPPYPPFYELCYDYLAGAGTLDAMRAGAILQVRRDSGQTAHEQLYAEFVEPYRTDESVERAVAIMVERMRILEKVIVDTQEVSRAHAVTLAGASIELADESLDKLLMHELIIRLEATNASMRAANEALSAELDFAHEALAGAKDELERVSREGLMDPLTGVSNRAGLDQAIGMALADASSGQARLALAVVDIDHFKRLNDTCGHQAGDEILRVVGRALVAATRSSDLVGRMGGDEFVVILRVDDEQGPIKSAEAIRRAIPDCDVTKIFGKEVLGGVTASIGVAEYRKGDSASSLFDRADRCLLDAKTRGRNQVVAETPLVA